MPRKLSRPSGQPRGRPTVAAQARKLAASGMSPPEIARKLGKPRQAVHAALARGDAPVGRPKLGRVRHTVALDPETDALARAEAERWGVSVSTLLVAAIEGRLRWSACQD